MELQRAQAILEVAHSAVVSMDEQGRVTYWNAQAETLFGLPREQAYGRILLELIIPERYREAHRNGLRRFLQSGVGPMIGRRVELSALRADGTEFPTEMTISALAEGEQWSFHAFIADISARRAAEQEHQRLVDELQRALQGSEHRLSVIVDSLAEAVTIRGLDNHVIYANRAALERLGMSSVQELREADPEELLGPYEIFDEHGREVRMADIPSVRLLRGEQPAPMLLRYVDRASGGEEWTLLKAAAVRDTEGQIEAAVTIIEDVTAAKRSAQRLEFIVRAGHILASSLDYQQTLRNIADLAVPRLADWCAVELFDEDGDHEQVAVAHIDPVKRALAERLRESEPRELDPQRGLGVVWRTGQPLIYNDITDEMIERAARDEEHLGLLREIGIRSALIVPMIARGRTIGALTLINAESVRTFDEGDLEFVEQIAARAALAVENSRLYSERSAIAQTLQQSLLPEALPELPGWEIAALYRPAGREAEVGGDFYDIWETDGEWLLMIGDVTGKGIGAAAVTSLVRHTARAAADFDSRPAQVLARVDGALRRESRHAICTALCMRISGGQGTLASGGHPLPLCLTDDGVHEIGSHGTLLGAFDGAAWSHGSFSLQPGQTLVAITDGVTDTLGPGRERFGPQRLREVLARARGKPPQAIRDELAGALDDFQVGVQSDDTAIVVMRFNGS